MILEKLKNSRIAILGFGKEGQSTLRFLVQEGIENIDILDADVAHTPEFELYAKKHKNLQAVFGKTYLDALDVYDYIIKSPGISPFHESILPYKDKIISQTHIFFDIYKGKTIGITGTKGKSTISSLIYTFLREAGFQVALVGNIGKPVLDEISLKKDTNYDYIVYELSSYMLQDFCPELTFGYINNIYPCHLDWHYDSFLIYKEAKANIIKNAQHAILNAELIQYSEFTHTHNAQSFFGDIGDFRVSKEGIVYAGEIFIKKEIINIKGRHNLYNIAGACTLLAKIMELDDLKTLTQKILPTFQGLPHRQEEIGVYEGIHFIDDAIATTPESTIAAIDTFDGELQTLLLGGEDSGFNFTKLREKILNSSIRHIVAFPDTSELIFPEISLREDGKVCNLIVGEKEICFIKTRSMQEAVHFCFQYTLPGKYVLLSSAAPSFSVWKNYQVKAKQYRDAIEKF